MSNILPFIPSTRASRQLAAYQEAIAKAELAIINLKVQLAKAKNYKSILQIAGVKNYDHIS